MSKLKTPNFECPNRLFCYYMVSGGENMINVECIFVFINELFLK